MYVLLRYLRAISCTMRYLYLDDMLHGVGTHHVLCHLKRALPYLCTAGLRGAVQRYGIELTLSLLHEGVSRYRLVSNMLYVQLHTTTLSMPGARHLTSYVACGLSTTSVVLGVYSMYCMFTCATCSGVSMT